VIETRDLVTDLQRWDSLYIAGRLQKPVKLLSDRTKELDLALQSNLKYAVNVAVTIMALETPQPSFSEKDLYLAISRLSYEGDIRMLFAEDPQKVENIVNNNFEHFAALYRPVLEEKCAKKELQELENDTFGILDSRGLLEFPDGVAFSEGATLETVQLQLRGKVRRASVVQSVKGLLSAGMGRSLKYVGRKISKRFQ
jgi:translocator assembly and maintenance protein 41